MNYRAYLAELIGTFFLTLVVYLSVSGAGHFQLPTAVLAGMTLGLMVYVFGSISGAQLNPAVTLGLASIGKMKPLDSLMYVVMQFVGAFLASMVGLKMAGMVTLASPMNTLSIFAGEALGATIFLMGISSVVHSKVSDIASGLVIGTALTLGAHIASLLSHGVLNPAVAFGISSFSPAYVVGPIVGAVIGCWIYAWIIGCKKKV